MNSNYFSPNNKKEASQIIQYSIIAFGGAVGMLYYFIKFGELDIFLIFTIPGMLAALPLVVIYRNYIKKQQEEADKQERKEKEKRRKKELIENCGEKDGMKIINGEISEEEYFRKYHQCPKCKKVTKKHQHKWEVSEYKYKNKDGTADQRYSDNPFITGFDYSVKCRHCKKEFYHCVTNLRNDYH